MKLWWLPPSVAIALIVSGTVLAIGSVWLTPTTIANEGARFFSTVVGLGLGAGMIINGIARSTRPPEGPK